MREHEWITCKDPLKMVRIISGEGFREFPNNPWTESYIYPKNKIRHLACAFARQVWDSLVDPHARQAVEFGERIADGEDISEEKRAKIWQEMSNCYTLGPIAGFFEAELALLCLASFSETIQNSGLNRWLSVSTKLKVEQCAIIRDIFGNVFKPIFTLCGKTELGMGRCDCDDCQRIRSDNVMRITESIYNEMSFHNMPILADALEDKGCKRPEILEHLRGVPIGKDNRCTCDCGTECPLGKIGMEERCTKEELKILDIHTRGCWVLDLIKGRF